MLRVKYEYSSSNKKRLALGALVRVPIEAKEVVYLLVTHYSVLPSSALSSLKQVKLYAPSGVLSNGIDPHWVRCVSTDAERRTSLIQLTQPAVHAMLAAGVTCLSLGTAADGMSVTHFTCEMAVVLKQTSEQIIKAERETITVNITGIYNGMLVDKDGNLLAVTKWGESKHYSLVDIVKNFLEERKLLIRCSLQTMIYSNILYSIITTATNYRGN